MLAILVSLAGSAVLVLIVGHAQAARSSGAHYIGATSQIGVSLLPVYGLAAAPVLEERLGTGATGLMRGLRVGIRKTFKTILAAERRWREWIPATLLFCAASLAAPLFDRSLLRAWQERGLAGVRTSLSLGLAVYVRLLFDRRSPLIGKVLLAFAVSYGVASRDLIPDAYLPPLGLLEDLLLVTIASRTFLRLCPDRLIEQHATRATRSRARTLRQASTNEP
jgi:uncharacterized membrane protein YkvA (DUF1232 family)